MVGGGVGLRVEEEEEEEEEETRRRPLWRRVTQSFLGMRSTRKREGWRSSMKRRLGGWVGGWVRIRQEEKGRRR